MTLTAAAKIELIETALADGKYRTLQKQLRDLRDAQQIIVQCYLSDSHESLKAEANRIILELKPIAETQDKIETVEQKTDEVIAFIPTEIVEQKINEVLASLPPDTIVDNSAFGVRINTGNADEKIWLVKKDGNGAGVTFVKTECGRYYESYAGDALRSIILLGTPTFIWAKVLKTQVAVPEAVRLQEDAQKLGFTLYLYDRPNDTETPKDASVIKTATATEAELYKTEFEVVVASLPVSTVVTNRDFASKKVFATEQQTMWLSKKAEHFSDIVILKVSNLSAIAYAGDALRLVAILGTRPLIEGGTLKTHIPMLDLEGVLHDARKKGFDIKVCDADQTVILHKPE